MSESRIRVLHLIKTLGKGGAEVLLAEGLRFADRERFEYGYGYFVTKLDALAGELKRLGATVVCFDATSQPSLLLATRRVVLFCKSWKPDLIHAHQPLSGVVARLAGRTLRIPVVYTEHNRLERYHPLTRVLHVALWSLFDQVIACSDDVEASIRNGVRGMVPLVTLANGVDTTKFDPKPGEFENARTALGIAPDAHVVGTVAVFRTAKRLDLWLRAAHAIKREVPDVRFLMAGDGPLYKEIVQQAESSGLADSIVFAGMLFDPRTAYEAMDVFMSSSDVEGLPIALLEAMSMEVPVVVTRAGGVRNVVRNNVDGISVEIGDVDGLSSAVIGLLKDRDRAKSIAKSGRERVRVDYSLHTLIAKTELTYTSVLLRSRATRTA